MCAIFGFHLNRPVTDQTRLSSILTSLVLESAERGRDSAGVAIRTEDGQVVSFKTTGHPRDLEWTLPPRTVSVIGNTRAEPTTEYIPHKTDADVQPFTQDGVWVVHNGTIANDKELKADLPPRVQPPTSVDSWIIAPMIAGDCFDYLVGSLAVAWFTEGPANQITLYRNYKPIKIFYNFKLFPS